MDLRLDLGKPEEMPQDEEKPDHFEVLDSQASQEAEQPLPEEPPARAAQPLTPPAKTPSTIKKKLLITGAVIIILFASILGYVAIPKPVDNVRLTVSELAGSDGIQLNMFVSTSSVYLFSGTGDVSISTNGVECYSGTVKVGNNAAIKQLEYSEFVEGNGEYTITTTFEGSSSEATHDVDFIVTDLNAEAAFLLEGTSQIALPEFTLSLGGETSNPVAPPRRAFFTIESILHEDGVTVIAPGDSIKDKLLPMDGTVTTTYTPVKGGNYTVTVGIENEYTKATSAFNSFSDSEVILINAAPIAKLSTNPTSATVLQTVEFDATASIDDSFNLKQIVKYQFIFGDDWTFDEEWYDTNGNGIVEQSETHFLEWYWFDINEDGVKDFGEVSTRVSSDTTFDGKTTHVMENVPLQQAWYPALNVVDRFGKSGSATTVINKG